MFCKNCGAKISEGSKFCQKCGAKITDKDLSAQESGTDRSLTEEKLTAQSVSVQMQNAVSGRSKESEFTSDMRIGKGIANILYVIFLLIAMISAVHSSGCVELDLSEVPSYLRKFIRISALIPETVSTILSEGAELLVYIVLMRFFSKLHKPLTGWFIANIICVIILFALEMMLNQDTALSSEDFSLFISLVAVIITLACCVIEFGLGIAMICNYEGSLKTFAFLLIIRSLLNLIIALMLVGELISPVVAAVIVFIAYGAYYFLFVALISEGNDEDEDEDEEKQHSGR